MRLINLIPYLEEELSSCRSNLERLNALLINPDVVIDKWETQQSVKYDIERSNLFIQMYEYSMESVVNGVHYDLGDFEERDAVSASDYNVAETLRRMKVGMPYTNFTVGFTFDMGKFRVPIILTINLISGKYPFFLVIPWMFRNNSNWSLYPSIPSVICFSKDMNLIVEDNEEPEELGTFFKEVVTVPLKSEKCFGKDSTHYESGFNVYTVSNFLLSDQDEYEKELKEVGRGFIDSIIQDYFLRFIYLLNTRGVTTETIVAPAKLNRKRAKKNKRLIPSYKVLKFRLPKTMVVSRKSGKAHDFMAFHTCPGHTKTYLKERPLFGHYVGPVWCPQHVRGSREKGVITKDYALKKTEKSNR